MMKSGEIGYQVDLFYNFKKGSGGKVINTLGEFEWTNSFFLRILINLYSKFK